MPCFYCRWLWRVAHNGRLFTRGRRRQRLLTKLPSVVITMDLKRRGAMCRMSAGRTSGRIRSFAIHRCLRQLLRITGMHFGQDTKRSCTRDRLRRDIDRDERANGRRRQTELKRATAPQGLKPIGFGTFTARQKSCPDTKPAKKSQVRETQAPRRPAPERAPRPAERRSTTAPEGEYR